MKINVPAVKNKVRMSNELDIYFLFFRKRVCPLGQLVTYGIVHLHKPFDFLDCVL